MPFFDPPPPPPRMPDFPSMPREGRYVPGVVPLEQVLALNDRAAVVLRALFVYPDGVSFQLDAYVRHREASDFDAQGCLGRSTDTWSVPDYRPAYHSMARPASFPEFCGPIPRNGGGIVPQGRVGPRPRHLSFGSRPKPPVPSEPKS